MSYNTELQANNADLQKILDKVNALPEADSSGGVVLPDLVNPASPQDMAAGKTLYDDDGNPVSGTLAEITSGAALSASDNATVAGSASTGIRIKAQRSDGSDYILRSGAYLMAAAPANQFGDAAAADVAKGKTFTSAEGLLVEGTHECDPGLQLAPLANPAGAADIVSGKALYDSDGNLVVGTMDPDSGGVQMSVDGETLVITGAVTVENDTLIL
jgi:hypothetical protein